MSSRRDSTTRFITLQARSVSIFILLAESTLIAVRYHILCSSFFYRLHLKSLVDSLLSNYPRNTVTMKYAFSAALATALAAKNVVAHATFQQLWV